MNSQCAFCDERRPYADFYNSWIEMPVLGAVCPKCKNTPLSELDLRRAYERVEAQYGEPGTCRHYVPNAKERCMICHPEIARLQLHDGD